jgi:nitroimidazol reductase NimA-like FMN-containing flavoprotein (pyridoxamine 5'-phosphate oxidase superfamily)
VPVNFTREGNSIYIHSSPTGMKIDCIRRNSGVCLTVLARHRYLEGIGNYSYQCVIVYGRASLVADNEERLEAYRSLCAKIDPVVMSDVDDDCVARSAIIRIEIDKITGKKGSRD